MPTWIIWEEHLSHLRAILKKVQHFGITAKMAKCQWAMTECSYLGHVIGGGDVKPEKTNVFSQFHRPRKMYGPSLDSQDTIDIS